MKYTESTVTECKRQYTEDIRKEIIAFANTSGGTVYIGVEDDGTVLGIDNADLLIQRICNVLRDSVRPDITMFVSYETVEEGGLTVLAVHVQQGTGRPYYLASKGLRPEGVYVRQGTTTAPATETAIRAMIRETDGDSYEDRRAVAQELTFTDARQRFEANGLAFGENQMVTLGLRNTNNIYTNLALLLSDQCPHIIKAATFSESAAFTFQDRREFSGSLLKQIDDAYAYLDMHNQTASTFSGLYRNDQRDYPESALRETLLNAVVHRDYSLSAPSLISIYPDHIDMVSIGGLLKGVELNDVMLGISVCRNPKLAAIFYRLRLIEAYGTGLQKIVSSYSDSQKQPVFTVTANAFKVSLPKMENASDSPCANENVEKVLRLFDTKSALSRSDLEKELEISTSTAARLLKELTDSGALRRVGSGKTTKYQKRR